MPNHTDAPLLSDLEPVLPHTPNQSAGVDPDNPSWGILGALAVWFLSVCLVLFLPAVLLLGYAAVRGITPNLPDYPKLLVEFAMNDKMGIVVQIAALLPSHLLTLFLVWALVTRFGKRPFFRGLGWSWSGRFGLWPCIGLGIALFILANFTAHFLGGGKTTPIDQLINSSLAARYLISFLAVATAPVVEEFVYRGVLYAPLQRLVGVPGAVILVLALFTIIHVPQYLPNFGIIAAIGLLSIALTLIRAYSKRLLPCVVIHFVFNGIQAGYLVLQSLLPASKPAPPAPTTSLFHLIGCIF